MRTRTSRRRRQSPPPVAPLPRSPLARLHALRHRFTPVARAEKLRLVQALVREPPRSAEALRRLHDDLLFLRAFPDDLLMREAAASALLRVAARVRALPPPQRRQLDDSGIAGSTTRHAFGFGVARWLSDRGEKAEIDWTALQHAERLDPLLRLALAQAEADAFDSGELSTREWLTLAGGPERPHALAWLSHSPARANGHAPRDADARDAARTDTRRDERRDETLRLLYDGIEVPVRWRPSFARSTSGNVVAGVAPVGREAMRAAPADVVRHVVAPMPGIERLSPPRADPWLDAARAALAARCREVHAITYANRDEVYLADLGCGTTLCLIGAARGDRLTLEANYGYVLFANGVPVGYGGVTPLAAQANTGINIFDAFRHGEAAMLFAQALRAFRTLFGVARFVVNPYQFGAGNDEALASGAYWFYDRLGFRAATPAARALADRERERLAASRNHRSSPRTLRALAATDLVLELPTPGAPPLFDERWLVTLARAVTVSLAAPDIPARLARRDAAIARVARTLSLGRWHALPGPLRFGLERLGPLLALVMDDVARWRVRDRRALVALLAAKGEAQERDFAVLARQHRALWRALSRRARTLERAAPAGHT
jgi:hypothetical protein